MRNNIFDDLLFNSVLEYLLYQKFLENISIIFWDTLWVYFRLNPIDNTFFDREWKIILIDYSLTKWEKLYILDVINFLKNWAKLFPKKVYKKSFILLSWIQNDFSSYFLDSFDSKREILFLYIFSSYKDREKYKNSKDLWLAQNSFRDPTMWNKKQLKIAKKVLEFDKENFYVNQWIAKNKIERWTDVTWLQNIDIILKQDPLNPIFIMFKSRLFWSAFYKKTSDKKFLKKSLDLMIFAKKGFNKLGFIIPTYYSWLSFLYLELHMYDEALKFLNISINMNKKKAIKIPTAYMWKAMTLTKLWKLDKARKLYEFVYYDNSNIMKRRLDFRFYKNFANLLCLQKNFIFAKDVLSQSIYLYNKKEWAFFVEDIDNNKLVVVDYSENILINCDNYLFYYEKWDFLEEIIFVFAYLLDKKNSGCNINFKNTRWIEKICLFFMENFLRYEKKCII